MSLSSFHNRSQNQYPFTRKRIFYQIENLVIGVFYHFLACVVREGFSGASIQKSEEIVNFSHGSHSRTRIFIGCLLFDGNYRAQSGNQINIRTFHVSKERPGISRKCFDIAPLPFGINSIESQRRFAATAKSCNYSKFISGDFDIYILQIVNTSSVNNNLAFLLNYTFLNVNIFCFLHFLVCFGPETFLRNLQYICFLRRIFKRQIAKPGIEHF